MRHWFYYGIILSAVTVDCKVKGAIEWVAFDTTWHYFAQEDFTQEDFTYFQKYRVLSHTYE
jgi:uncharacterized Fe-S cluster-containing radical SAM superfamily protein